MTAKELEGLALAGMMRMEMPLHARADAKRRIKAEVGEIRTRGIVDLLVDAPPASCGLKAEEVLGRQDVSAVAFFLGKLGEVEYPMEPTDSLEEFWRRCKARRALKMHAPSEAHVESLILVGAFGEPQEAMERWAKVSGGEVKRLDYPREMAQRTGLVREVDLDELAAEMGCLLTTYAQYVHPESYGQQVVIVGQVLEDPEKLMTRVPPKRPMAKMVLEPLDETASEFEDSYFHVVIFPDAYESIIRMPKVGDIVAVSGRRDIYVPHRQVQVIMNESGGLSVLTG